MASAIPCRTVFSLFCCLMTTAVLGEVNCPNGIEPSGRFGAYRFSWENDSFNPAIESDRDYSNGLRLSFIRNPCRKAHPPWTERLVEAWCRSGICDGDRHAIDVGYVFGQDIYTPQNTRREGPQPFDRPYAGHLFGSWVIQATHSKDASDEVERTQTTIEMQVGLVGPHAYAEELQNGWHRLLGEDEVRGWRNQLEDEPAINLNLQWRRKLGFQHLDFLPHWGVALGTTHTNARVGATLRIGTDLTRMPQFLLPQIRRHESGRRNFAASAYVGAEGRYVAHDIFLEGGFFNSKDDVRVDPKSFVYDLKGGASARWKNWTFDYAWTKRSVEFESRLVRDGREQIFRSFAFTRHLTIP